MGMSESTVRTETLLPEPAYALGGLLAVPVPDLENGAGLPLLWHWVYLAARTFLFVPGCPGQCRGSRTAQAGLAAPRNRPVTENS
jgi:hypothetical protein